MNIQPSQYLSGVRDEMKRFVRMQKRPSVNELEGMVTRMNTGIALTEELEAEACLQKDGSRRPHLTLITNHDNNGGDAA
ncbi:hypothetical protein [Martelella mediterranea]|uniref:Uncharacterized protein n=1 Tax=Martelella mediterranea TaxID=293089 RepID=A0A4R3NKL4_9HYPH|nr:hypothetical protein [Martelella mediterranea]TCT35402.1 hypothetical protein EDC90_102657 [Martelella mediterranea]